MSRKLSASLISYNNVRSMNFFYVARFISVFRGSGLLTIKYTMAPL